MRNTLKVSVAGALVAGALATATPAHAAPSALGFYPSTDVYADGIYHFDFDTYSEGLTENFGTTFGITYGIGDKAEVGFDYGVSNFGDSFSENIFFNAKYKFLDGGADGVSAVVGAWGLGKKRFGYANIGYVKASKNFDFGRVNVGVARSFGDEDIVGDDKTSLTLGYDKYITPNLQFAVDFYSGKNSYAGVQPSLYYYINEKANFGLGYMLYNNSGLQDQVYFAFDYNFDFKKTAEVVTPTPAPETTTGTATN